eukprot:3641017-Pyramimonas_sp.AAC.1
MSQTRGFHSPRWTFTTDVKLQHMGGSGPLLHPVFHPMLPLVLLPPVLPPVFHPVLRVRSSLTSDVHTFADFRLLGARSYSAAQVLDLPLPGPQAVRAAAPRGHAHARGHAGAVRLHGVQDAQRGARAKQHWMMSGPQNR